MSDPPSPETARALRRGLDPEDSELVERLRGMEPFERARRSGQPISAEAYARAEGLPVELRVAPAVLDAFRTAPDDERADDEKESE